MTITKEAYVDLQEKYDKVMKLIKEVDPETTPYASKYLAKRELLSMKARLDDLLRKSTNESTSKEHVKLTGMLLLFYTFYILVIILGMLGAVYYYLGSISVDVEELVNARKFLDKCREVIEPYKNTTEVVQVAQMMFNQLAILTAKNQPQDALIDITQAKSIYEDFKTTHEVPVDVSDLFVANIEGYDVEKAIRNYEKNYTLTLYYLAQIYGALKDALKSSVYCHVTLQRQLEYDDYDPIDWALNSATLSQFFMEKNGFKQARHHLAASSFILDKYRDELNRVTEHNEENDSKLENFKHRYADVARCWAKYGLLLLSVSKERLLKNTDDLNKNESLSTDLLQMESTLHVEELSRLDFPTLDLGSYESQITDQFVLTMQDARKVFANIQDWLNKAHEYYTINNLASDYIEILQDKSQMYANLAFFEENPENQAKLHKRRADLLETVLKDINPTYYLQYCRQIWFELAQIYTDILDIKIDKVQQSKDRPSPHALQKINTLVDKSIQHYTNFINSFKSLSTNELPQTISEDFEKPFLQAYFNIAALYSRYIVLDKQVKLQNDELSLQAYKKVVDYCQINTKAADFIPQELPICKQMVELLPLRIAKTIRDIN